MTPSIQVTRRERSSNLVQEAIRVHGPVAAEKLMDRLKVHLQEGETLPDLWTAMVLMLRWLVAATAEMIAADAAHERELANDKNHRTLRDETTAKLIAALVAFRDGCKAFYGATRLEEIGFTEQTPRDPLTVLKVARKLVELLGDPEALPAPRFVAVTVNPMAMADTLKPLVEALVNAMTEVTREIRKAESTQAVKNDKVGTYDSDFFWIARWLQATFALGGMTHEAARLKPSLRRRGRTETEPAPDVPETTEDGPGTATEP